jgi:fructose transport system ATP-binding protein
MTAETKPVTAPAGPAPEPFLVARGLTKRFGHVTALDGADFDLLAGEVLGLIGDNGAGKSTLIKILSGALQPDEGSFSLDGHEVTFHSPSDARKAGIETVYQDLAVSPALDVATNMFLGREIRRPGLAGSLLHMIDHRAMREETRQHLVDLGITLYSVTQQVETLSGGQRQALAVARAAAWGRRVIIMDEPTAALGVKQSRQVLDLVRRIRDRGLSIVLISHSMPDVFAVADRIAIMRLGRRVAVVRPAETPMTEVVSIMVGAMPAADASSDRPDDADAGQATSSA